MKSRCVLCHDDCSICTHKWGKIYYFDTAPGPGESVYVSAPRCAGKSVTAQLAILRRRCFDLKVELQKTNLEKTVLNDLSFSRTGAEHCGYTNDGFWKSMRLRRERDVVQAELQEVKKERNDLRYESAQYGLKLAAASSAAEIHKREATKLRKLLTEKKLKFNCGSDFKCSRGFEKRYL